MCYLCSLFLRFFQVLCARSSAGFRLSRLPGCRWLLQTREVRLAGSAADQQSSRWWLPARCYRSLWLRLNWTLRLRAPDNRAPSRRGFRIVFDSSHRRPHSRCSPDFNVESRVSEQNAGYFASFSRAPSFSEYFPVSNSTSRDFRTRSCESVVAAPSTHQQNQQ